MAEVGVAYVSILPSARGFGPALNRDVNAPASASGAKVGAVFGKAFALAGAAVIGAQIGSFLKSSISEASNLQQSIGGVQAVFGKYSKQVQKDSKAAAQAVGLSRNEYNELITVTGALLKNKGLTDFAKQSREVLKTGADLSATFGGSTKEAVDALNAALRGESDPIERYGISLNETAVNAELAAKGLKGLKGPALDQAKAQARLAIIARQSADAQGRFAEESDTLAGQQQRLGAQFDNFKATLGTALLPVLTDVFKFLNNTALPAIRGLFGGMGEGQVKIDGLGDRLGVFGDRLKQVRETATSVFESLRTIFSSTISILRSLWDTFGASLVASINRALESALNIIEGVFNIIAGILRTVAAILQGDWSEAWEGIKQIARGALQVLKGIVQGGLNSVKTVFSLLGDALGAIARGFFDIMVDAGKAIIDGLVAGIKSAPGAVKDALFGIVDGAVDGVLSKLGIRSPSKVFVGIGQNVVKGFALGLEDTHSVSRAADNLAGATIRPQAFTRAHLDPSVAKGAAGSAGSGRVLLQIGGREFEGYMTDVADSRIDAASQIAGMEQRAY